MPTLSGTMQVGRPQQQALGQLTKAQGAECCTAATQALMAGKCEPGMNHWKPEASLVQKPVLASAFEDHSAPIGWCALMKEEQDHFGSSENRETSQKHPG